MMIPTLNIFRAAALLVLVGTTAVSSHPLSPFTLSDITMWFIVADGFASCNGRA
jgi:hypothetical protein